MSAVANVAINVDSRGAASKLKQVANRSKELEKAVQGASAAVTKTGRELKTAANGMQYFIDATGGARKANGQFVTTAEAAAAGLEKQGRSAQRVAGNFNGLIGTVGKLAAAYLTLNAAQSAVGAGIKRIESERRIEFLAKQYGEVDQLARAAAKASERFGLSQTSANKALADVFARLRPVGVSLENIVSVYNGFNTAARISGSTAVEAESAFRQLSQALGSGALRGDEFNSIAEQVPGILTAISQETGVAQGKLREYAADGKITADVVIAALQRIERDGADQLKEALGGPEQAIRDFQNATEDVQVALTTAIVPEMARAFRDLAAIIEGLEPSLRFIGGVIAETLAGFRTLVESIRGGPVVERLRQGGGLGFNVGGEKQQLREFFGKERFAELEKQAQETAKAQGIPMAEALAERARVAIKVQDRAKEIEAARATAAPTGPTTPLTLDRKGEGTRRGGRAGLSPEEILERQQQVGEELLKQKDREFALIVEQDPLMRELLQISYERADAEERVKDAAAGQRDELLKTIQQVEQAKAGLAIGKSLAESLIGTSDVLDRVRSGFAEGLKIDEQLQKANQEADIFKQTMEGVGQIMSGAITNAIDGLIDGTAELGDIFRDVLKQLGSLLLNAGLNQLAGPAGSGGILSFLGFGTRANGGPVLPGSTYLVGERGPELLTMGGQGGYVHSNTSAAMDRYRASGSRLGTETVNVNYSVTEINGMRFVTEEEFRAGMDQAAKRGAKMGQTQTMSTLKNSRSQRSKIGL